MLGLNCQLADVDTQYLLSVEAPAVFLLRGCRWGIRSQWVNLCWVIRTEVWSRIGETLQAALGRKMRFASPRRIATTPRSRFGWSWFTPLLVNTNAR